MFDFRRRFDPEYKPFKLQVGRRLRAFRLARRRSIATIAYMTGLRRSFLDYVEKGERCLSLESAHLVAIALRISLSDLVGPQIVNKPRAKRIKRGLNANGYVARRRRQKRKKNSTSPSDKKIQIGTAQQAAIGIRYPSRKKQKK